jgi:hypothetical protein
MQRQDQLALQRFADGRIKLADMKMSLQWFLIEHGRSNDELEAQKDCNCGNKANMSQL